MDMSQSDLTYFYLNFCDEVDDKETFDKSEPDVVEPLLPTPEYSCKTCGKVYNTQLKVEEHARRAHAEKKIMCGQCGKKFVFKGHLRRHQRRHAGKPVTKCSLCGIKFEGRHKLKHHITKFHADSDVALRIKNERVARRKLSSTGTLRLKMYEKSQFKCEICIIGYRRRALLVQHMNKQHPDVSLDLVPTLQIPVKKKTTIFSCHYCDKSFPLNCRRTAHTKKYHPESDLPTSILDLESEGLGLDFGFDLGFEEL